MDVIIVTAVPSEVDPREVKAAMEAAGFYVATVTVTARL